MRPVAKNHWLRFVNLRFSDCCDRNVIVHTIARPLDLRRASATAVCGDVRRCRHGLADELAGICFRRPLDR